MDASRPSPSTSSPSSHAATRRRARSGASRPEPPTRTATASATTTGGRCWTASSRRGACVRATRVSTTSSADDPRPAARCAASTASAVRCFAKAILAISARARPTSSARWWTRRSCVRVRGPCPRERGAPTRTRPPGVPPATSVSAGFACDGPDSVRSASRTPACGASILVLPWGAASRTRTARIDVSPRRRGLRPSRRAHGVSERTSARVGWRVRSKGCARATAPTANARVPSGRATRRPESARCRRCASMVERRRGAATWCGVRVVAVLLTTGCALSYERDEARAHDGGRGMDGGSTLVRDGGAPPPTDAHVPDVPNDVPRDVANDVANDVPAPVDEALRYAERRCAWAAQCSAWATEAAWLRGEASCVNAERRRVEELRGRGHVPPVSTWCGAPEVDADCDGVDDVEPCTPAPGALAEGEACVADSECGLSASGGSMACAGCRCAAFRTEGADCSTSMPCGPELVCGSDRRCRRRITLADGERCTSLTDAAEVCRDGSTCHRGLCVRSPRYRDRCDPTGPRCTGTHRCVADADGVTRCEAAISIVAAGGVCTSGQFCAGGARCPREGVCPTTCADDPRTCGLSACDETFDDCLLPPLTCSGS